MGLFNYCEAARERFGNFMVIKEYYIYFSISLQIGVMKSVLENGRFKRENMIERVRKMFSEKSLITSVELLVNQ
ncbi:hypothetical protein C5469_01485 [Photorhabdus cinerea]|uniref:Uncharacterized protein n=1 Tax=Photorhabdus cinerea TaxID=471575 RepID=A0A7X5QAT5_9GAMM|nr:hypothetical protein [Photorhabdus cinerea]